jgi:very-short-patch-repair endonuclease
MKYYSKKTMHLGAQPSTFSNTAYLRRNPTRAEEILWARLRNNQLEKVHFRRQHPFINYVPDFYANEIKLVIELDGDIHEEKSVKFTDEDRELNLKLNKLFILRYKNEDVYQFENEIVEDIREWISELRKRKKRR